MLYEGIFAFFGGVTVEVEVFELVFSAPFIRELVVKPVGGNTRLYT